MTKIPPTSARREKEVDGSVFVSTKRTGQFRRRLTEDEDSPEGGSDSSGDLLPVRSRKKG